MKICSNCNIKKSRIEFYPRKNRKIGLESRCKDCYNQWKRAYRAKNKHITRAQNKKRNPGWDINRYNEYVKLQNNRCAICSTNNPILADWCCDHDHNTHQARGLLCVNCNAGLGYFKDNPESLQSAIDYLKKWQ